jgi:hypothetical protein
VACLSISETILGLTFLDSSSVAHVCRENELSLKHGWRILSSYPVGNEKVWIITEADRSYTTILLPKEY